MQHHGAPTRLLDWSDGALIALHFAVQKEKHGDSEDAFVYVLEPDRLKDHLEALPETSIAKQQWTAYAGGHPFYKDKLDEWEHSYLPADDEDRSKLTIPRVPLLLEFPHITRRVAAQRSRFIVFGSEPNWLSDHSKEAESCLRIITIEAGRVPAIRRELRDGGVTESVIFPDMDGLGREIRQLWEEQK